jgi:hypothetical protein
LDDGAKLDPIGTSSWRIPNQIIYPNSFAVLLIPSGKFALNNTADTARIFNENKILIDSVSYDGAKEDLSFSLVENKWTWTSPTPNAQNTSTETEKTISQELPKIVINELFPEPARKSGLEEFIELYNPSDKEINLDGYKIADLASSYKPQGIIAAGGYFVIKKSDSNISLNNSGSETVTLTDAAANLLDSVSYEDAPAGESYNLMPNGNFVWSTILTPGKLNKIEKDAVQTSSSESLAAADNQDIAGAVAVADVNFPLGEIAGSNITQNSVQQAQANFWPWLVASFALNLLFCYILVKLMLTNDHHE